jgi:uncharacterized protein (TIGR02466 family)
MPPEVHIEKVFWTPVIVTHVDEAEAINRELEQVILQRRDSEPSLRHTNVGGWHSSYDLMEWGGEPMQRLRDIVVAIADDNVMDLRGEVSPPDWIVRAWANVSERGHFNTPHAHGASYWSAVYYVRVDEGEGGTLVLHDPRTPASEMHAPLLRFRQSGGERFIHTKPEAGLLVVMPSWLVHSVTPWQGEGLRISVAINLAVPAPG